MSSRWDDMLAAEQIIDTSALLAWLEARRDAAKSPLIKAVYEGLRMRVHRGDFGTNRGEQESGR